jgi:2-keto-4-pentenoate hydratase
MRRPLAARCLAAVALIALGLAPRAGEAACPSVAEVARLAGAILAREAPPPPRTDMSMQDALCARDRLVAVFAQPWGDQVGWKVGLTNPAAQQRFGVAHPVAGAIFHGTVREQAGVTFPAGTTPVIPARFGIAPAVESDLVVRIRDEGVNEAGDDHVALLRHVEAVFPFIELPDLVYGGATVPWSGPLLVSINVGARLGVLGEPVAAEATPAFAARLGAMTVVLRDDRRELARVPGTALLGHPLNALSWLVRDLKEQGRRLRAGDYVSLGGFSPALPVEAGRTYTATYEGLAAAPVSVSVELR